MSPTSSPEAPPKRARSRWFPARHEVVWLFAIALVVRAAAALVNPAILNDSVSLLDAAARVGRDGLGAAIRGPDHPLGPWIVSLAPSAFGAETWATAITVVAGAFAVWPLHVLTRRACGRHAATAACIVYAALPKAVGVASVPLTSGMLVPLFLSGMSVAAAAAVPSTDRRRFVRLVSAGLLCGAAYLCRPEGLLAAAGSVLAAGWLARRGRRLVSAAIVAAAFSVVAVPYVVAVSSQAGGFALSPKKDVAKLLGVRDAPSDAAAHTPAEPSGPPAGEGGREAAAARLSSALEGALTAPIILLVLAGAFLPGRWRHPRKLAARATLVTVAAVALLLCLRIADGWDYLGARHVLPGALLLLPFAGEGFLFLGVFISRAIARRRLAMVLASFFAIPCAVRCLLRPEGEGFAADRALGERLAEGAPHDAHVVVASFREPLVAYYAGRALSEGGGDARNVTLLRRFGDLFDPANASKDLTPLADHLRTERAQWLVVDLFRTAGLTKDGRPVHPGRDLAERLVKNGVLATPVVAAGSELAAFPVR